MFIVFWTLQKFSGTNEIFGAFCLWMTCFFLVRDKVCFWGLKVFLIYFWFQIAYLRLKLQHHENSKRVIAKAKLFRIDSTTLFRRKKWLKEDFSRWTMKNRIFTKSTCRIPRKKFNTINQPVKVPSPTQRHVQTPQIKYTTISAQFRDNRTLRKPSPPNLYCTTQNIS